MLNFLSFLVFVCILNLSAATVYAQPSQPLTVVVTRIVHTQLHDGSSVQATLFLSTKQKQRGAGELQASFSVDYSDSDPRVNVQVSNPNSPLDSVADYWQGQVTFKKDDFSVVSGLLVFNVYFNGDRLGGLVVDERGVHVEGSSLCEDPFFESI